MEATRVIAIRHGETDWNVDLRIQGQLDISLNDTGRRQARRLALALADESLHAVYSSDLARARETAQAVAAAHGLAVLDEPGLRERAFGRFEGLTFREIEERWPDESARWRARESDFAPGGGEALCDFYARCVDTATRLASAHVGQTIALVAHGGVLDCLYRAGSRMSLQAPRTWRLENAGINRLLYSEQGFTLVGWGDVFHLEDDSIEREGDA